MRAPGIIVVLIILMLHVDPKDLNRFPEASVAIEGNNEILRDCGQGFAASITFSFTCHCGFPFKGHLYLLFRYLQRVLKYSFTTAEVTICLHKVFFGAVHR